MPNVARGCGRDARGPSKAMRPPSRGRAVFVFNDHWWRATNGVECGRHFEREIYDLLRKDCEDGDLSDRASDHKQRTDPRGQNHETSG